MPTTCVSSILPVIELLEKLLQNTMSSILPLVKVVENLIRNHMGRIHPVAALLEILLLLFLMIYFLGSANNIFNTHLLFVFQSFKSRGHRIVALVPPQNAPSDIDSGGSEPDIEEDILVYRTEEFSSPCPSIDSYIERMNILESSENDRQDNTSIDSDETYVDADTAATFMQTVNEKSQTEDKDGGSANNSVLEVEDNLNHEGPPLTPIINMVLPPTGEVNYNALPSLASLLSIPSSDASPIASPSTSRTTRRKRKLPVRAVPNVRASKAKKTLTVSYKWKKGQFRHKADIPSNDFVFDLPDIDSPLDYFHRYFTPDILDDIVYHTNLYSTRRTGKCIQLTIEELKDFLMILLVMGIVNMPSYLDYWSAEFRYAQVADVMPLKRFEQIRRNIHFVDSANSDDDRYYKIRPFIEKIRRNCLATEEETKYSIDEMTIPYKGTKAGNRRQYNPMKPNKWGFKNVVRAGESGIVYDFLLYGGDDTFRYIDFSVEEEQMTLGAKMVLALCKTIQTPGCAVYFDNYFTTLDLIWYLREHRGIFSLGTIRQNRLKGCSKGLLSDKELKKKGRGTFSQVVDNDKKIAIVKWYDNKVVTLACSYADAYPVQEIKRWSKEQKKKIGVTCPELVRHYNQHMGGVDLCDMLIALYRTSFKSRRWYMNIFGQMLDIAVNNAWLLYRRKCTTNSLKNISLKKFRQRLAIELRQKGRSIETEPPIPVPKKSLIQNPSAPRPPVSVRYDGYNHWAKYTTYGRCKYCKNNKTNTICSKCDQRLCLVSKRNCFYNFHNK